MEVLSLEDSVSESMKKRLDILLLTRSQSLTAKRNHTILQTHKKIIQFFCGGGGESFYKNRLKHLRNDDEKSSFVLIYVIKIIIYYLN